MPAAPNISDQNLLRKIQTSVLASDQKRELQGLLPNMTAQERAELSELIDHSIQEMIDADPELQKKIRALNEEYDRKMQELVRHQNHAVREEFEKLEGEGGAREMRALEGEIGAMKGADAPVCTGTPTVQRHHYFLKFCLILFILLLIAAGAAFGLNYL